jgi:hypothetical protein
MEISGARGKGREFTRHNGKVSATGKRAKEEANGVQRCRAARMQQKTRASASAARERWGEQGGGDGVWCVVRGVVDGRKATWMIVSLGSRSEFQPMRMSEMSTTPIH